MHDRQLADPPAFTWPGFRAGAVAAVPLAANAAVYGVIFGALAAQAKFDLAVAMAMSALVYAGGAQLASLQIWAFPVPLAAVWATTFAVNARYILQSAALRPWLAEAPAAPMYGTLFTLSDAGWALSIKRWQSTPVDGAFLLGTGAAQYVTWTAGTAAGHALSNSIGSPAAYGLDFIVPAFFAAMAAGLWKKRSDIGPLAVGAGATLVAGQWIAGHWSLLVGALAGSLIGVFVHERKS